MVIIDAADKFGRGARSLALGQLVVAALIATAQPALSQSRPAISAANADGADVQPTLTGCRLPLPGGQDRDSGLGGQYISDRQGSPYLFAPSLTARQTYTDNVTLAGDGDEESDHISQLIPAFTFCQIRPRLRTQVDYQAQLLQYWGDSDRNDVFHQLNADTTATLVRDRLFLDLGARYDQQPRTLDSVFGGDNELVTGDREDALTLRASPYVRQSLGGLGNSVTRYEYRRSTYDDDTRDTTRHIGSFLLTSPAGADPITWQGQVRTERVDRDAFDRNTYFDDAFVQLGYRAIGRLILTGRGGLETVNRPDGTSDRFDNEYWEAGFRWSDARTSVEARYGERFFGETYFAALSRTTGRFTASVNYRETQEIPERTGGIPQELQDIFDEFFDEVPEPEVTVSKRFTASGTYETGRSTIQVSGFNNRQQFIVSDEERQRYGVNAFWRWQFHPRTTLTPRLTWERIGERGGGEEDTLRGARISLARMVSRNTQAGATVRRQERQSQDGDREYVENAITLELTQLF